MPAARRRPMLAVMSGTRGSRGPGPQCQGGTMKPGINGGRKVAKTRRMRAAALGVAGAAAAAAVVGLALPASASTVTPQHHAQWGTENFQLASDSTSQTSTTTPIIAYGVFTAAGTDYQNPN